MIYWEELSSSLDKVTTYRAKVMGGWLVMVYQYDGVGVIFYPDPQHLWDGSSLP